MLRCPEGIEWLARMRGRITLDEQTEGLRRCAFPLGWCSGSTLRSASPGCLAPARKDTGLCGLRQKVEPRGKSKMTVSLCSYKKEPDSRVNPKPAYKSASTRS
jgi:hypothetical protein